MKFKIEVRGDGFKKVNQRITQARKAPAAALEKFAAEEVKLAQDRIRSTKVDPDGQPWEPWSMATIRQRSRSGGRGLLYRTGALLNSIQSKIRGTSLSIFSMLPYAGFLQNGTSKMPARKFLGWSKDSISRFKQLLQQAAKDRL